MPLHLIKLAVGVEDVDHLARLQGARMAKARAEGLAPGAHAGPRHVTRMWPTRRAEILDGGSLYWVIRGVIRARQPVVAFAEAPNPNTDPSVRGGARPYCAICLMAGPIVTQPRPHRAFQGWRYFDPAKAPPDASGGPGEDLPAELARQLGELGLL